MIDRRSALSLMGTAAAVAAAPRAMAATPRTASASGVVWVSTTERTCWQAKTAPALEPVSVADPFSQLVSIGIDSPAQPMEGFGGAFGEKGWQALSALPERRRNDAMAMLFGDGGAAFNLCRTPLGANDIARGWYSYNETDGDFGMDHFSIANDRETLIPYIKAAQAIRPELRLWASPWSPPTWMKRNRHYAMVPAWPGNPSNGIQPEQHGREGEDFFIQDDRYFAAYARYFRRYVEEYGREGIRIGMVMPQNEFNSAQPFPSCCWTPAGLARFIPHLAREMGPLGVEVFFGTLERGNAQLLNRVLADPQAAAHIRGVGVQWAGKNALTDIAREHPTLPIWGSEQECGRGTNDWHYTRYSWDLMKRYFAAGARA
ncbi:MAG: glycoside hydrolase family 30 protein, partial [Sphingopyxis sp.]